MRKDLTAGAVRDHGPSIGPLSLRFNLDDDRLRRRPALGLILDQQERPLRLTGLLILSRFWPNRLADPGGRWPRSMVTYEPSFAETDPLGSATGIPRVAMPQVLFAA